MVFNFLSARAHFCFHRPFRTPHNVRQLGISDLLESIQHQQFPVGSIEPGQGHLQMRILLIFFLPPRLGQSDIPMHPGLRCFPHFA